jgi:hypothetical protein
MRSARGGRGRVESSIVASLRRARMLWDQEFHAQTQRAAETQRRARAEARAWNGREGRLAFSIQDLESVFFASLRSSASLREIRRHSPCPRFRRVRKVKVGPGCGSFRTRPDPGPDRSDRRRGPARSRPDGPASVLHSVSLSPRPSRRPARSRLVRCPRRGLLVDPGPRDSSGRSRAPTRHPQLTTIENGLDRDPARAVAGWQGRCRQHHAGLSGRSNRPGLTVGPVKSTGASLSSRSNRPGPHLGGFHPPYGFTLRP